MPTLKLFHPPSEKNFFLEYSYDDDGPWSTFVQVSKQKYPWWVESAIRTNWLGKTFWVGVDQTKRAPATAKLTWIAFGYSLMDHPVWVTFGNSREEAASNMMWAISDTVENFNDNSRNWKEYLNEYYSQHGEAE